jgi:hypothetical protein
MSSKFTRTRSQISDVWKGNLHTSLIRRALLLFVVVIPAAIWLGWELKAHPELTDRITENPGMSLLFLGTVVITIVSLVLMTRVKNALIGAVIGGIGVQLFVPYIKWLLKGTNWTFIGLMFGALAFIGAICWWGVLYIKKAAVLKQYAAPVYTDPRPVASDSDDNVYGGTDSTTYPEPKFSTVRNDDARLVAALEHPTESLTTIVPDRRPVPPTSAAPWTEPDSAPWTTTEPAPATAAAPTTGVPTSTSSPVGARPADDLPVYNAPSTAALSGRVPLTTANRSN